MGKILFVVAVPKDMPRIDSDEEYQLILDRIKASRYRDQIELEPAFAAEFEDLTQRLSDRELIGVHFSGHGTRDGQIMLVGSDGRSEIINKETVRKLFDIVKDDIQVVVLNACFTVSQAEALKDIIGCVIGTKCELYNKDAVEFAGTFYKAIGDGCSVQKAFELALMSVSKRDISPDNVPRLMHRSDIDPRHLILIEMDDEHSSNNLPRFQETEMSQRLKIDKYIEFASSIPWQRRKNDIGLLRGRTFDILRNLQDAQKARVLLYLYQSGLIQGEKPTLDLSEMDFSGADLEGENLSGANLRKTNLVAANLAYANLRGTNFTGAKMWAADLRNADLREAVLRKTDLTQADLEGSDLTSVDIEDAILMRTKLGDSIEVAGEVRAGVGDVMVNLDELLLAEDGRVSIPVEKLYRFEVVGSSMNEQGISDGDYVIVNTKLNYEPSPLETIVTKYLPLEDEPGESDELDLEAIDIDRANLRVTLKVFYEAKEEGLYRLGWKTGNAPLSESEKHPMILTRYIEPIGKVVAVQNLGSRIWVSVESINSSRVMLGGRSDDTLI
jgi:uncharacterized protein YjbI with pentapeptide repeats